jgi:hypothetical protein
LSFGLKPCPQTRFYDGPLYIAPDIHTALNKEPALIKAPPQAGTRQVKRKQARAGQEQAYLSSKRHLHPNYHPPCCPQTAHRSRLKLHAAPAGWVNSPLPMIQFQPHPQPLPNQPNPEATTRKSRREQARVCRNKQEQTPTPKNSHPPANIITMISINFPIKTKTLNKVCRWTPLHGPSSANPH